MDILNQQVKRKGKDKTSNYILFIDLKKAYDSVDRDRMLIKMAAEEAIPQGITTKVAKLLAISAIKIGEDTINTWQGLPQGSCISPALFSIYSADLIERVKEKTGVDILLYADDICIVAYDKF